MHSIDAAYCYTRCYLICLSVCLSVTLVYFAKSAAPIKMPFGVLVLVGPSNHVLDWGLDPLGGRGSFGMRKELAVPYTCLLYTSDAADE